MTAGAAGAAGAAEDWQKGNAGVEAILDGFTTAAGAVAPPGATTRGPAAEALLEGAENGSGSDVTNTDQLRQ